MSNQNAITKVINANPTSRVMSVATKIATCDATMVKWFDGNKATWLISRVPMFGRVENLNKGSINYVNKIWEKC